MSEAAEAPRESREFHAITDAHTVQEVTGYICEANPGIWWVPKLGYSMSEGNHLFPDRIAALAALQKKLRAEMLVLREHIARVDRECVEATFDLPLSTIEAFAANTSLMAAAPELFEALEELSDIVEGLIEKRLPGAHAFIDSFTLRHARAALAKATGSAS